LPKPTTKTINISAALNQKDDDKSINAGTPTRLVNLRRYRDGNLVHHDKRKAWHATPVDTFNGADYSGPATELHPLTGAVLFSDSAGQLFVVDPSNGEAYFRGKIRRAHWTGTGLSSLNYPVTKPALAKKSDQLWYFAKVPDGLEVTVVSTAGTILAETYFVAVTGVVAYGVLSDEDDNRICAFTVANDTLVKLHVFRAPGDQPTTTTWVTQGSAEFMQVDCELVDNKLCVAALSEVGNDTGVLRSFGFSAGTTPSASDYDLTTNVVSEGTSGLCVLPADGGNGNWYLSFVGYPQGAPEARLAKVVLQTVSLAAPSTFTEVLLGDAPYPDQEGFVAATSGCHDNTETNVLVSYAYYDATFPRAPQVRHANITRYRLLSGTLTDTETTALNAVVASKPFKIAGEWRFLSMFDDSDFAGNGTFERNVGIQNGYFVRDLDGHIYSTVLDGDASLAFHNAPASNGVHVASGANGHTVPVVVDGTKAYVGLTGAGASRLAPPKRLITIETAQRYHSAAPSIVPGGVPALVTQVDTIQEVAPIHYPHLRLTTDSGGAGVSTNYITYRYTIESEDGDVRPSAPYPSAADADDLPYDFDDVNHVLTVKTLKHVASDQTVRIDIFGSPNGGAATELFLQASVPNDPTVDTVDIDVSPRDWKRDGPLLETVGGGLEQASLPPATCAWIVGNRLFFGGTPDGQIWPSLDRVPGEGYQFNETLAFRLPDGSGVVVAGSDIDGLSSLVFATNGVFELTGAGPDGKGQGGYQIRKVSDTRVCTNPRSIARRDSEVYFQDANTGAMCVYQGGQIQSLDTGMYDLRDRVVVGTAVTTEQDERCVRFITDEPDHLVWDTTMTGSWILHEGAGMPEATSATTINGVPVLLTNDDLAQASLWSPATGEDDADYLDNGTTQILTDYESGEMELAGGAEFDTDTIVYQSEFHGGTSTYQYTLTDERGSQETKEDTSAEDSDFFYRSGRFRTNRVKLRIRETAATGRGRSFRVVSIDVRPYNHSRQPARKI
jgi:hypothetical protein